jgi:hypothetical protein
MANETQVCTKCKLEQSTDQFYYNSEKANKLTSWCRACCRGYYHTEHGRATTEKYRKSAQGRENAKAQSRRVVLKRHNITQEFFDSLIEEQDNKCAICGTELQAGYRTHIDHNHSTGSVRGLLCSKCNTGLGLFREDKQILLNAVSYLEGTE